MIEVEGADSAAVMGAAALPNPRNRHHLTHAFDEALEGVQIVVRMIWGCRHPIHSHGRHQHRSCTRRHRSIPRRASRIAHT